MTHRCGIHLALSILSPLTNHAPLPSLYRADHHAEMCGRPEAVSAMWFLRQSTLVGRTSKCRFLMKSFFIAGIVRRAPRIAGRGGNSRVPSVKVLGQLQLQPRNRHQ